MAGPFGANAHAWIDSRGDPYVPSLLRPGWHPAIDEPAVRTSGALAADSPESRVGLSGLRGGLLIADHVPGGEGAAFESTLDPPDERGCDVAAGEVDVAVRLLDVRDCR